VTRPRRILLCVVATHLSSPRCVVAVTRVASGDFRGLRVLHLGAAFAL